MRMSKSGDQSAVSARLSVRLVVGLGIAVSALAGGSGLGAGGEDCPTATPMGALPYIDTGNTCAPFLNTYGETCGAEGNSRDVVYMYTPGANGCVNIILCNSSSGVNFKLYVYASDAGGCPPPQSGNTANDIACNDTFCAPYARINGLPVNAGVTYWIVVDGSSPACGDYLLEVQPCECTGPQDCADGNTCTADLCQGGACQNPPAPGVACGSPADTECDNPDTCDGSGQCVPNFETQGAACGSSADTDCDNPDTCDGSGQCQTNTLAQGSPCGSPADTDCDNPDSCNASGQCLTNAAPNGTACDDGQFCTVSEQCTGGVCTGGQPRLCNDGLACTEDACDDEADACEFNPSGDCCQSAPDCDDGNPCTLDQCGQGVCSHPPAAVGTPCGDPGTSACTAPDTCDGAATCQSNHVADGVPCDDGDVCTVADACSNGFCVGASDPACAECAQGGSPADPTNQVSFQAILRNAAGQLINGSVDLVFQFYDVQNTPVGGSIAVNDVVVTGGVLSTAIPIAETIFDGTARELGISINGTPELSPRIRVTSTPQSFRVGCVDGSSVTPHLGIGNETEGGALRLVGPGTGQGTRAAASAGLKADVHANCGGTLSLYDYASYVGEEDTRAVYLSACDGPGGQIVLSDDSGDTALWLRAGGGSEAEIKFLDDAGNDILLLDGEDGSDGGALIELGDSTGLKIELDAHDGGGGGVINVSDSDGDRTVEIDGSESDGTRSGWGVIRLFDASSTTSIQPAIELNGHGPNISLFDPINSDETISIIANEEGLYPSGGGQIILSTADGNDRIELDAHSGGGGSFIKLRDDLGNVTIELDADYGGVGRVTAHELEIVGGCDLSERFDVSAITGGIEPGLVVSIDPVHAGKLSVSTEPYDSKVAGIISGAGGIKPGMLMAQSGSIGDGAHPVALSGRVWCWADASIAPIGPGDRLTTSTTPGHAMKAEDPHRSAGAVVGKAMTPLAEGRGLVLVLVQPQ